MAEPKVSVGITPLAQLAYFEDCFFYKMTAMTTTKMDNPQKLLSGPESNPGLPRDRQKYSPLYKLEKPSPSVRLVPTGLGPAAWDRM